MFRLACVPLSHRDLNDEGSSSVMKWGDIGDWTALKKLVKHQLAANFFWSSLGEVLFRGTTLLLNALVARILGAAEFGVYGWVRNGALTFGGLGAVGLSVTANRFLPEYERSRAGDAGALIGATLGLSVTVALAFLLAGLLGADWVATAVIGKPELTASVQMGIVLVALTGIGLAQLGVLQGLEAFKPLALGYLISGVLGGTILLIATLRWGITGALLGLVVMAAGNAILFQVLIHAQARNRKLCITYGRWRVLAPIALGFVLPVTLNSFAIGPLKWLAESLLARLAGLAEAGRFYAAMLLLNVIVGFAATLHAPLVSMVARYGREGASPRLQWVSLYASWVAFVLIALPVLVWPTIPGKVLGVEFQGPEFTSVVLLVLLYCGLQCYAQGLTRAITQSGSMWILVLLGLVEGLVLFGGAAALSSYGATGMALACVLSYVVRLAITVPLIANRRLLASGLLADRIFLLSSAGFLILLAAQWIASR